MKKKKVISAIVLFSLALSSCKQCPEDKDKDKHDTLDRSTLASPTLNLNLTELDRLIKKLAPDDPDSLRKLFETISKALKHAADVISNPASANRSTFSVAKGFSSEVEGFTNDVRNGNAHAVEDFIRAVGDDNRNRAKDTVDAAYADAILHAAYYAEYVITEVAQIPPVDRSQDANAHAADVVRNFVLALARYFATNSVDINADAVNAVNELATKVGELKRFFEDWQSRQLGH